MKTLKIIASFSFSLAILCLVSCKNNENKDNISKQSSDQTDANFVEKHDTLAKITDVKIIETFENENPLKVHFVDKIEEQKVYEKQYYDNGNLFMEGLLVNDLREGEWIAYYENGVVWSTGFYENGLKQGKSNVFYENGKLRYTKSYKNDLADGVWYFYDDKGNLIGEDNYENGEKLKK
ncbi:MAG: hypothetical protein RBR32_04535 [Bacteroidales bacterium]|nr:hypothetical protein [Bacteroidales bacterium]